MKAKKLGKLIKKLLVLKSDNVNVKQIGDTLVVSAKSEIEVDSIPLDELVINTFYFALITDRWIPVHFSSDRNFYRIRFTDSIDSNLIQKVRPLHMPDDERIPYTIDLTP